MKNEAVEVNNGRFGPYVKYGSKFVSSSSKVKMHIKYQSLLKMSIELIKEKEIADAPDSIIIKDTPVHKRKRYVLDHLLNGMVYLLMSIKNTIGIT